MNKVNRLVPLSMGSKAVDFIIIFNTTEALYFVKLRNRLFYGVKLPVLSYKRACFAR